MGKLWSKHVFWEANFWKHEKNTIRETTKQSQSRSRHACREQESEILPGKEWPHHCAHWMVISMVENAILVFVA